MTPESLAAASLEDSLEILECRCNTAAYTLDHYKPRKPSLTRLQQLLIYIATLSNSGNTKESYLILGEAVQEACEINLPLEEKWVNLSEFTREVRRKIFWNLYVWDRYADTVDSCGTCLIQL
jgi:hypothetical protein